jgi:hypothetical protein
MTQGWYFLASAAFVRGETQMRFLAVLMALLALVSSPLAAQDANGNGGRLLEYERVSAAGLPYQRLTIWLPPGYDVGV